MMHNKKLARMRRKKDMATHMPTRRVDYLLVGGGLASATAAEEIRKRDKNGSIVIVTTEPYYPYHRPPLSKEYIRGEIGADGTYGNGGVYIQTPNWYKEQRIEVQRSTHALVLDPQRKVVSMTENKELGYHTLLIATGGRPRRLQIPGYNLKNVCLLRTLADSNIIREQIKEGTRFAIIGSGFIGMEVAASALSKGAQVTIIEPQDRIWPSTVSPELSDYFQQQFASRGATLRYGYSASEFVGRPDGRIASVRITPVNGQGKAEDIPCDIAVVGIGIQLNTEFAATGELQIDQHHGIIVDQHLETNVADIFAAGDIAAYIDPYAGRMHFEHWDNAIASGQVAAANMTKSDELYRHVPYFFSDQFDLFINMLGYPSDKAQIVIRGNKQQNKFTAFYVQNRALRSALMVNDDEQMDLIRDLIAAGATVSDVQSLSNPNFDLNTLKQEEVS
jgi:3-phenylpropionate/trans-cinnamate dioxygenase ferredoxin reductase subunit